MRGYPSSIHWTDVNKGEPVILFLNPISRSERYGLKKAAWNLVAGGAFESLDKKEEVLQELRGSQETPKGQK